MYIYHQNRYQLVFIIDEVHHQIPYLMIKYFYNWSNLNPQQYEWLTFPIKNKKLYQKSKNLKKFVGNPIAG